MENKSKNARLITIIAGIIVALVVLSGIFFGFYTKIISIKDLGDEFLSVFWTNFGVKIISRIISFVAVFVMFFISTLVVGKITKDKTGPLVNALSNIYIKIIFSVILAIFASAYVSETIYDTYLLFANSTNFGIVDPLFGADIGYYLFTRPFMAALINSLLSVWFVVIIYCIGLYAFVFGVNEYYDLKNLLEDKPSIVHNLINIVIFFLLKAMTYRFTSEEILYSNIGDVAGAGYTDIYVWYNFYKIAPIFLIVLVAIALFFFFKSKYKALIITILVYPITIVCVSLAAVVVQNIIVNPNELIKQKPYLEYNLQFTKDAFNLNNVIETEFPVDNNLTVADIEKNANVLKNIRITDFGATLTAYNSLQGIRDFYKFNNVDVSKYDINGDPTLVMLSPRGLNKDYLDEEQNNYTNRTFRYTHGFGVVMSPQNRVTKEGQPEFLISNIPPKSEEGVIEIKQPRIYYGENMTENVIVNSTIKELDYLEGSEDKEFSYDGKGGINLNFLNRVAFAIENVDFNTLISNYIKKDSKILINRNVKERVELAMPFLTFDEPNFVIDDNGYLKWIIDGYTTSSYYPYSQTYNDVNYIRNSVKVVVDAYDGTIDAYIIDKNDPIIASYTKAYPGVFKEGPLPSEIINHIVYPENLFKIQSDVYARYHVNNATSFYNDSDFWVLSKEKYNEEYRDIAPYYNILKINEFKNSDNNFVIMIPYTLRGKENMTSWLAASCDESNYGQMVVYRFPKGKNIYGTQQIEARIDNNPAISKEMTLWGQGGSNVIRGNTLVVPIETSLLYIEPIYITSQGGAGLPELKRVIVAYGDRVVMEPTFEAALEVMFKNAPPSTDIGELPPIGENDKNDENDENLEGEIYDDEFYDVDLDEVIDRIIQSYNNANSFNQNGDWEGFGENMTELDKAIKDLENYKNNE